MQRTNIFPELSPLRVPQKATLWNCENGVHDAILNLRYHRYQDSEMSANEGCRHEEVFGARGRWYVFKSAEMEDWCYIRCLEEATWFCHKPEMTRMGAAGILFALMGQTKESNNSSLCPILFVLEMECLFLSWISEILRLFVFYNLNIYLLVVMACICHICMSVWR